MVERAFRGRGLASVVRDLCFLAAVLAVSAGVIACLSAANGIGFMQLLTSAYSGRNMALLYGAVALLIALHAALALAVIPRRQAALVADRYGEGGIRVAYELTESALRIECSGGKASDSTQVEYGKIKRIRDGKRAIAVRTQNRTEYLVYREAMRQEEAQRILSALRERCPGAKK